MAKPSPWFAEATRPGAIHCCRDWSRRYRYSLFVRFFPSLLCGERRRPAFDLTARISPSYFSRPSCEHIGGHTVVRLHLALSLGAIQHTVRMVPGLSDVHNLPPRQVEQISSGVQMFQELGGMAGRILFAVFRRPDRLAAPSCPLVFHSIAHRLSLSLFSGGHAYFGATPSWNLPCHLAFQRTPQLLGKLFAPSLSHSSARRRRKFRSQHRRQSVRRSPLL